MNLNSIQKKWLYRALIALIFIFAFAIRVYHLEGKKAFHIDEILSLVISDCRDVGWLEQAPEGEYSGKELKEMIWTIDPSLKDGLGDICSLWHTNNDSPHTNFYYTLLRISLVGIDAQNVEDFKEQYIFRAGMLNVLLFSLSFVAFFVLLNLLIKDKILILLGLVLAFFNTVGVSYILFFRPYILQALFAIIFSIYLICISKKIENNEYKESWQNMFIFALPLSLMLLAGYYSFIYAFFLGLSFVLFQLRKFNRLDLVPFFFFGACLAVLFDLLFYQGFLNVLNSSRTSDSLGASGLMTLVSRVGAVPLIVLALLLVVSLCTFAFFAKTRCAQKYLDFSVFKKYLWFLVAVFLTCIVIAIITPCSITRHISPFFYIGTIAIPLGLTAVKSRSFRLFVSIAISLLLLLLLRNDKYIQYKNIASEGQICFSAKGILGEENGNLPVYIFTTESRYSSLARYLSDEEKYIVCNSEESFLSAIEGKDCLAILLSSMDISQNDAFSVAYYVKGAEDIVYRVRLGL